MLPPDLPELLTISEASRLLKVHPNTLRNWEKAGKLTAIRLGSRRDRRYSLDNLKRLYAPAFLALVLLLSSGLSFLSPKPAEAAISKVINFQGKITTVSAGTNVADGTYAMEFKLYAASSGGSPLWTETFDQPSGACAKPTLTNGVFSVRLGSCNSLASLDFTTGSLYLSVNFAPTGTAYDGEMDPRKQLNAASYAFVANSLNGDGTINILNTGTNQATIGYDSSNKLVINIGSTGSTTMTASGSGAAFLFSGGNVSVGSSNSFGFSSRSQIQSAADGNLTLYNNAGNNFSLLQFGGTSSSFPALKRSTTTLQVKLADDSGYAALDAGSVMTSGTTRIDSSGNLTNIVAITASGAIAANGGITFDAATDTVGAFTAAGTIDMSTNILTNIGNSGTDFHATTGALTLAGVLTANGGITVGANQNLTLSSGTGVYSQTFSGTTQTPFSISSTHAPTSGGTQNGLNLSLTNNPSSSANTLYGQVLSVTESSNLANTVQGVRLRFTDAGSGASTKTGIDVDVATANSSDTTYAAVFQGGNVGIGEAAPVSPLHVESAGGLNSGIRLEATSGSSYSTIDFYTPSGLAGQFISSGASFSNGLIGGDQTVLVNELTNGALQLGALGTNGYVTLFSGGLAASNERLRVTSGGSVGIGTTGPDRALEINHASGNNLRLTYNDSNGSAANYVDLLTTSGGNLSIRPSGFVTEVGGGTSVTQMRFLEPSGTGTDYVGFKAPADVTTSVVWSLPAADGTGCLKTNSDTTISIGSCGAGGSTLQGAYDATSGNTILTTTGRNIAFTLGEVASPTSFTLENQDTAGTSAQRIFNSIASGTLTNGLLIEQTGAGTLTNAIQIAETAGTITDGILVTGTLGNILNSGTIDITGGGAITGVTGITLASGAINVGNGGLTNTGSIAGATTGSFSGAIAANGGITFDNSSDTLGAFTFGGNVDANANILENIGNTGTDFIATTGALTLAGVLSANGGITVANGQTLDADGTITLGDNGDAITLDANGTVTINDANISLVNQATDLDIIDNTASAFTISQGSNNYFLLTTTNGAPVVTLDTLEAGGTMNFGLSNFGRTINIGTGTGADVVHIGEGGTTANTITIGSDAVANTITIGSASATGVSITDDQWSINASGAASFASVTEGGTALSSKYAPIGANFITVTANGTLTGETGIDALSTAISTTSTLNVDFTSTLNTVTLDAGANFSMLSGTGLFTQTHAPSTDATADAHSITLSAGGTGSSGTLRGLVLSQADTGTTGVYDSMAYILNQKTPETTTNGIFIENNAASGTMTNAINITNTAGTLSNGISFGGTMSAALKFNAAADLDILDNSATAFTITEAGNQYLLFNTDNTNTVVTLDTPVAGATSTTLNLGTAAVAKTINIGSTAADVIDIGNAATSAKTIRIGSGAVANTITIGSASATNVSITDNNWSVNTSGVANFITGSTIGSLTFTTNNIADSGALTIKSASGANAITIDSGTTGAVNIGTGTSGKTINIGTDNTTADTLNIGSALDGVTITSNNWSVTSGGLLTLGKSGGSGTTGQLKFLNSADTDSVIFQASTSQTQAAIVYTLPITDGDPNQLLQTDGSGGLTWATVSGGGYATIQDEGGGLTPRTILNFTGAGVSCSDNAGQSRTDCTIAAGGAGPWTDGSGLTYLTDTTENLAVGASTGSAMLNVGSGTNRGNVDVYGDVIKKALTDETALANINDVYVYDTAGDSNTGYWRKTPKIKQMSWYTETKDDGPGDACNIATDDRCGESEFPEKAVIATTNDGVYIFDAAHMKLWMKFTQSGTFTFGADTNNNPSGIFAINGVLYVGTNGASATGLYAIDFVNDRLYRYNTTNRSQGDKDVANRNTTVTYNVDANTRYVMPDNIVNDVHGTVVQGAAAAASLNGDLVIVVATDTAIAAITTTNRLPIMSYSDVTGDDYNAVWITKRARIFAVNETQGQLEKWLNLEAASLVSELNGTPDKLWDESATAANLPNISPTAPNFSTSPDTLSVIERTSLSDDASDTIYLGTGTGLTVIQTNATTETSGWVKRYTKDYITENMIGDVKAMFTFHQASGDYVDVSRLANVLDVKGAPTYGVNGVRGTGANFDNTNDHLCSDANNDATCDNDTDYNVTTAGFMISGWFKHSTTAPASGVDVIISKRHSTTPAAVAGWEVYMDTTGRIAFAVDDDTTWSACTPATDDCAISPAGTSYADNNWHHFLATRTTGATAGFYLYLDGKLVNSDTTINSTLTLDGAGAILGIGSDCSVGAACATGANFWDGQIDDIMFSTTGNTTSANLLIYARRLHQEGRAASERKTIAVTDATAVSSTTIGDSGEAWIANEFVGSVVEITGGTGVGQTREVVANTATTMTVWPAWTTTPDTTSDFAVNPEELFGASDNVRAIGIADVFVGEHRKVFVGTNDGSDGGGVTVFNNVGYVFATDIYHSGAKKVDDSSDEWTGTDFDDMQSIADTNGATTMASLGGIWMETSEFSMIELEDRMQNYLSSIRIELRNDGLGGLSPEQGYIPGVDLAEYYYSEDPLQAGHVVAIDPLRTAGIKMSGQSYQRDLLGVVATKPGIVLGPSEESNYPVALVGRVPVKVSTENGVVQKGDRVTSSSLPGIGMRATQAGRVIGIALEGMDAEKLISCGDITSKLMCGEVLVFVNLVDFSGISIDLLMAEAGLTEDGSEGISEATGIVDEEGLTGVISREQKIIEFLKNFKANSVSKISSEIFTDRLTAAVEIFSPQMVTEGLKADSLSALGEAMVFSSDTVFFGRPYFNTDTAGFARIAQGKKSIEVIFEKEYLEQPVINATITLNDHPSLKEEAEPAKIQLLRSEQDVFAQQLLDADLQYIIVNKSEKGFTIKLNKAAPMNINFSWIALAVKNPKVFGEEDEPVNDQQGSVAGDSTHSEAYGPTVPESDVSEEKLEEEEQPAAPETKAEETAPAEEPVEASKPAPESPQGEGPAE